MGHLWAANVKMTSLYMLYGQQPSVTETFSPALTDWLSYSNRWHKLGPPRDPLSLHLVRLWRAHLRG